MKATIGANRQDYDEKMMKLTEELTAMITSMMDQIDILKSSPDKKDSPKVQDPTTLVPANKRDPLMESGCSTKIGGMWDLKHEISSPIFYELLVNIELKGDTDMELKNFYNHIKMCLNLVNRLREDLLTGYHSVNRHSEFAEYFITNLDHPS